MMMQATTEGLGLPDGVGDHIVVVHSKAVASARTMGEQYRKYTNKY